jgi:hypothetical protein
MAWVEGIAAAATVLAMASFVVYVAALVRLPTGRRPKITPTDRLGRPLPAAENPDYRDTEGD